MTLLIYSQMMSNEQIGGFCLYLLWFSLSNDSFRWFIDDSRMKTIIAFSSKHALLLFIFYSFPLKAIELNGSDTTRFLIIILVVLV